MSDIDLDGMDAIAAGFESQGGGGTVYVRIDTRKLRALIARVREQEQEIARLKERAKHWVCPDCGRDSQWDDSEYKGRDARA